MESKLTYRLRQAILAAVLEFRNPVTCDDVIDHPEVAVLAVDSTAVLQQWRTLMELGYLSALPGSNGEYARASALGVRAMAKTLYGEPKDVNIWGKYGL
jgi:hypothetical protein